MDDLMAKLQSVLNDEQSMAQIRELAGSLTGEAPKEEQGSGTPGGDFSQLLQGLGLGSSPAQAAPPTPSGDSIDMAKLLQLRNIMQQANKHDKNVDLLLALKPLLKEENQAKIDRLIKIFRLFAVYPALKQSGLLGGDLFGLL